MHAVFIAVNSGQVDQWRLLPDAVHGHVTGSCTLCPLQACTAELVPLSVTAVLQPLAKRLWPGRWGKSLQPVHANPSSCLSCYIPGSTLKPVGGKWLVPDFLPSVTAEALQLELACSWPVALSPPPLLVS